MSDDFDNGISGFELRAYSEQVFIPEEMFSATITFPPPKWWWYLVPGKVREYYKEIDELMQEIQDEAAEELRKEMEDES